MFILGGLAYGIAGSLVFISSIFIFHLLTCFIILEGYSRKDESFFWTLVVKSLGYKTCCQLLLGNPFLFG